MSEDLKAKARRIWEEIFPNADIEALAEVIHPDVVDHDDPPGAPQGFEGARSTMLWLHGVFSDQQWDIHHVLAEGDMVAVHCTMRATHTGDLMGIAPTGRRVEMDYIHLLRFEDGRVKDRGQSATTWQSCDNSEQSDHPHGQPELKAIAPTQQPSKTLPTLDVPVTSGRFGV